MIVYESRKVVGIYRRRYYPVGRSRKSQISGVIGRSYYPSADRVTQDPHINIVFIWQIGNVILCIYDYMSREVVGIAAGATILSAGHVNHRCCGDRKELLSFRWSRDRRSPQLWLPRIVHVHLWLYQLSNLMFAHYCCITYCGPSLLL